MNIYENGATQAIVSICNNEALWKKEILFNFLLKPFDMRYEEICDDIGDVIAQDSLRETIPDFTVTIKGTKYKYEVKIDDVPLTESEKKPGTRDAFLVPRNYSYKEEILSFLDEKYILTWEDLFKEIDRKGATNDFGKLALTREYLTNNSKDSYFEQHINYLYGKIINHESLRAFYRETFNKFFEYAMNNNGVLEFDDDTSYSFLAIFSRLKNETINETITIEYSYYDDLNFCYHHYGDGGIDDWEKLDVDFSECENLFARVEYLIKKVLPQYQEKLGNRKYKNFFKEQKQALSALYCDIENVFEFKHMSSELGNRLIGKKLKLIVQKIAAENKLELDDFYLSSEKWSGFYFTKKRWDNNYRIGFEFENKGYNDFFFGINIPQGEKSTINKTDLEKLKQLKIEGRRKAVNNYWANREYAPKEFRNWDIKTFKLLLTKPKEFKKYIEDGLKKYLDALKSANLF